MEASFWLFVAKLAVGAVAGFLAGKRFGKLSLGSSTDAVVGMIFGWLLAHLICHRGELAAYDFDQEMYANGSVLIPTDVLVQNFFCAAVGGLIGVILAGAVSQRFSSK